MTDHLRFSFEVACSPEGAFELWTTHISLLWPKNHSVSGAEDIEVVLEGRIGGRIYERRPSGEVLEWGTVTGWEQPGLLAYTWHLGGDSKHPTDVLIHFVSASSGGTRVEIDDQGWERFGADQFQRRDRNQLGWDDVRPHFIRAADKGGGQR